LRILAREALSAPPTLEISFSSSSN
jgi:hypothetical protein